MKGIRPTKKHVKEVVRASMSDSDAACYVPVQKFTLSMAMLAIAHQCRSCESRRNCCGCLMPQVMKKLELAIGMPPMFDEDFNLLPPPGQGQPETSQGEQDGKSERA